MTNKALNTGTMTNKEIMVQTSGMTWGEADFTWGGAGGSWAQPAHIVNKALNTGTMTNKAISA